ncbi:hypothetical protein Taro_035427 [Colocasia esculenta]|uniref:Uncharacterized protein n=1 Tax=Colocasia esculenta TaxID=4460 RepID=A0A843VUD2_COLES|nr:hypothetical protein [Colocasia esculenta]
MGNCFADNNGLVHPAAQPLLPEGVAPGGSSQIKVRMTAREFKELVSRAESMKCNTGAMVGVLIMEGVQRGKWEAVRVCDAEGGRSPVGNDRAALETIHED